MSTHRFEAILRALAATTSEQQASLRQSAENQLAHWWRLDPQGEIQLDFVDALLQIMAKSDLPDSQRMAAALYFKNSHFGVLKSREHRFHERYFEWVQGKLVQLLIQHPDFPLGLVQQLSLIISETLWWRNSPPPETKPAAGFSAPRIGFGSSPASSSSSASEPREEKEVNLGKWPEFFPSFARMLNGNLAAQNPGMFVFPPGGSSEASLLGPLSQPLPVLPRLLLLIQNLGESFTAHQSRRVSAFSTSAEIFRHGFLQLLLGMGSGGRHDAAASLPFVQTWEHLIRRTVEKLRNNLSEGGDFHQGAEKEETDLLRHLLLIIQAASAFLRVLWPWLDSPKSHPKFPENLGLSLLTLWVRSQDQLTELLVLTLQKHSAAQTPKRRQSRHRQLRYLGAVCVELPQFFLRAVEENPRSCGWMLAPSLEYTLKTLTQLCGVAPLLLQAPQDAPQLREPPQLLLKWLNVAPALLEIAPEEVQEILAKRVEDLLALAQTIFQRLCPLNPQDLRNWTEDPEVFYLQESEPDPSTSIREAAALCLTAFLEQNLDRLRGLVLEWLQFTNNTPSAAGGAADMILLQREAIYMALGSAAIVIKAWLDGQPGEAGAAEVMQEGSRPRLQDWLRQNVLSEFRRLRSPKHPCEAALRRRLFLLVVDYEASLPKEVREAVYGESLRSLGEADGNVVLRLTASDTFTALVQRGFEPFAPDVIQSLPELVRGTWDLLPRLEEQETQLLVLRNSRIVVQRVTSYLRSRTRELEVKSGQPCLSLESTAFDSAGSGRSWADFPELRQELLVLRSQIAQAAQNGLQDLLRTQLPQLWDASRRSPPLRQELLHFLQSLSELQAGVSPLAQLQSLPVLREILVQCLGVRGGGEFRKPAPELEDLRRPALELWLTLLHTSRAPQPAPASPPANPMRNDTILEHRRYAEAILELTESLWPQIAAPLLEVVPQEALAEQGTSLYGLDLLLEILTQFLLWGREMGLVRRVLFQADPQSGGRNPVSDFLLRILSRFGEGLLNPTPPGGTQPSSTPSPHAPPKAEETETAIFLKLTRLVDLILVTAPELAAQQILTASASHPSLLPVYFRCTSQILLKVAERAEKFRDLRREGPGDPARLKEVQRLQAQLLRQEALADHIAVTWARALDLLLTARAASPNPYLSVREVGGVFRNLLAHGLASGDPDLQADLAGVLLRIWSDHLRLLKIRNPDPIQLCVTVALHCLSPGGVGIFGLQPASVEKLQKKFAKWQLICLKSCMFLDRMHSQLPNTFRPGQEEPPIARLPATLQAARWIDLNSQQTAAFRRRLSHGSCSVVGKPLHPAGENVFSLSALALCRMLAWSGAHQRGSGEVAADMLGHREQLKNPDFRVSLQKWIEGSTLRFLEEDDAPARGKNTVDGFFQHFR